MTLLVTPVWADADETRYSVGLGFEFASGTYGTGSRTNTVFIPFTAAVYPSERLDLFVEIPVIYQSNNNVVSRLGGGMHAQQATATTAAAAPAGGMMGGSGGMGSGGMGQGGIGDITVRAGYVASAERADMPAVRPNVFVKFPTADSGMALGTGEFDGGFALELWKWLDKWHTFAEAGYAIQGKSPAIALKNYLFYSAGAGYQLTARLRPMVVLKGATAPVEGSVPLLETRLKLKYQATHRTGIEGYLAKGITTASPDYGAGIAVYYDF
ncbi:MAG: transporter [Deltaproteobacteria bacterium]|nr:transporter [Deltaproteobacteria bacterium]